MWWTRYYGPPAPCCGRPLYAKGLCHWCWRAKREADPDYRARHAAQQRAYREQHAERYKAHARKAGRKRAGHAMPHGELRSGPCEACGDLASPLNLDHCHATGAERGWLCTLCNHALGCLKDDPMRFDTLKAYLLRGR